MSAVPNEDEKLQSGSDTTNSEMKTGREVDEGGLRRHKQCVTKPKKKINNTKHCKL
jgi:hypothetical protein